MPTNERAEHPEGRLGTPSSHAHSRVRCLICRGAGLGGGRMTRAVPSQGPKSSLLRVHRAKVQDSGGFWGGRPGEWGLWGCSLCPQHGAGTIGLCIEHWRGVKEAEGGGRMARFDSKKGRFNQNQDCSPRSGSPQEAVPCERAGASLA